MYVSGQMKEMSFSQDVNHMSYMDISKLIKSLGYNDFKSLYYRHPKLALGHRLRPLNCDDDVLKFANHVKGYEVIEATCFIHIFLFFFSRFLNNFLIFYFIFSCFFFQIFILFSDFFFIFYFFF
jgi:hypothetical protein